MARPRRALRKPPPAEAAAQRVRERPAGAHAYARLLGLEPVGTLALLDRVEAGLGYAAVERFRRHAGLSLRELAALVQIPPRTLARRREEGRLRPDESDRLVRASRVFGKALELFAGDAAAARAWLSTPAPALGGRIPLDAAATEIGAREVEDLAGRLEHGVFA